MLDYMDDIFIGEVTSLDEHHPNPYEGTDPDAPQDDHDGAEEGLGGAAFNSNRDTQMEWRNAHDGGDTRLPDGQIIKGHCLSAVRQYRRIGPLFYSAKTQAEGSKDRHRIGYDSVNWSKVPHGAPLIYRVGLYWHITHFVGVTKVGPLTWTTDVPSGKVSLVDPIYFRIHWGAELDSWLGDLEGVDLGLTLPGSDPQKPPNGGGDHDGTITLAE
jgi:hypothetical protein